MPRIFHNKTIETKAGKNEYKMLILSILHGKLWPLLNYMSTQDILMLYYFVKISKI